MLTPKTNTQSPSGKKAPARALSQVFARRHAPLLLLSAVLALSLCGSAAFAADGEKTSLEYLQQALTGYNPSNNYESTAVGDLPSVYSLRNAGETGDVIDGGINVVTSVKRQDPFGACWSFAAVAASESSVISELYVKWDVLKAIDPSVANYDFKDWAQAIDFSERHLAWFVNTPLTDQETSTQAGEGQLIIDEIENTGGPNARMDTGGTAIVGSSVFSMGIGPVAEYVAPYMSKEAEAGDPSAMGSSGYYLNSASESKKVSSIHAAAKTEQTTTEAPTYSKGGKTYLIYAASYCIRVRSTDDPYCAGNSISALISRGTLSPTQLIEENAPEGTSPVAYDESFVSTGTEKTTSIRLSRQESIVKESLTHDFPLYKKDGLFYEIRSLDYDELAYRGRIKPYELGLKSDPSSDSVLYDETQFEKSYYDWSVDTALRFGSTFAFENSTVLPSAHSSGASKAEEIENMKRALLEGNALRIYLHADQSRPGATTLTYLNPNENKWAHYVYADENGLVPGINHAVTIVGYNDDYPASNFVKQPEGNGAWLAKNSWGSGKSEGANKGNWGIDEDGDGSGDGYFWISYYDASIACPEIYDFKVEDLVGTRSEYILDQYDYMPATDYYRVEETADQLKSANIFVAESDQCVREIGLHVKEPDSTVSVQVYASPTSADPTDGVLLAETSDVHFATEGAHRIPLNSPCILGAGERYAVVVTMKNGSGKDYVSYKRNITKEYAESTGDNSYGKAVVNSGESMLFFDGRWIDWVDARYDASIMGETGLESKLAIDNFPIKAYATLVSGIADAGTMVETSDLSFADEAAAIENVQATLNDILDEIRSGIAASSSNAVKNGFVTTETYDALLSAMSDPYAEPYFYAKLSLAKDESLARAGAAYGTRLQAQIVDGRSRSNTATVYGNLLKLNEPVMISMSAPSVDGRTFFVTDANGKSVSAASSVKNGVTTLTFGADVGQAYLLAYKDGNSKPSPSSDPESGSGQGAGDESGPVYGSIADSGSTADSGQGSGSGPSSGSDTEQSTIYESCISDPATTSTSRLPLPVAIGFAALSAGLVGAFVAMHFKKR